MPKRLFRWKVLIALSIILICSFFVCSEQVHASDESETWVIPSNSYNAYQQIFSTEGKYVIQQGIHPSGTSSIFYRTSGMCMTLDQVSDTYSNTGAFSSVKKANLGVAVSNDYQGSIVTTTYKMVKMDFINSIQSLGVTSKKIKTNGGSITVYIHNIFDLYNPNKANDPVYSGYTGILGYKEMINAGDKITGNNGGWPAATETALRYYYNFPYVITPTIFDVEILAVDKAGNTLGTLKSGDTGMYGEKYPTDSDYTAPETYTAEDGIKYEAADSWYCKYYSRTGGAWKKQSAQSGRTIADYSLPDAAGGTTVKMCVVYDTTTANIKINAVDQNTKDIIKEGLYSGTVKASENFEQPSKYNYPAIPMSDGRYYKKTVNFSYVYDKKGGGQGSGKGTTADAADPIAFTIPSGIKDGGNITVSIYYVLTTKEDIPINIIAVDKDSGDVMQSLGTDLVASDDTYINNTAIVNDITIGTKQYKYNGNWDWSYTYNSSTSPTMKKTGNGTTISFTAPPSYHVKNGITIKVYYILDKVEMNKIKLRVLLVGSSGKLIEVISTETVTQGMAISKTAAAAKSFNNIIYKYLNKWDYDYTTSSGSSTVNGSGTTATFSISSKTSLGSTVTLRFYYDIKQSVQPPSKAAPITQELDDPTAIGIINGDTYESPYFTSKQGISTTESQYVSVKTKDYLLGYSFYNTTGIISYYVPVTMHYTLQYFSATPDGYGGGKPVTEEVTDTQLIKVDKAYSYWVIGGMQYYVVSSSNVYNYSLPSGAVSLTAKTSELNLPSLATSHQYGVENHVTAPKQVEEGIDVWAEEPIISTGTTRPMIEFEDLAAYAITMTDDVMVENDSLTFGGSSVLSGGKCQTIAPPPDVSALRQCTTVTDGKALYTDGKVINAEKENGTYTSSGSVTYLLNACSLGTGTNIPDKVFSISVNNVIIHTPVICDPIVTADNDEWSQVIKPLEDSVQIVLDPDTSLNDFSIKISNTLQHSNRLGYYSRDFSRSFIDPEYISYIAKMSNIVRNEMKLPFDVYIDILDDNEANNDNYIKAGTWIILGRATARFYVPMWVQEGTYSAEFRTIAVNGTDKLNKTETTRNSNITNYVATSTKTFQISGRIYGLTIYDISDYPRWENVFRKADTMLFKLFEGATDGTKKASYNEDYAYYYTVGTKDQYGNNNGRFDKYTFPLINGSHPKYNNLGILKTGYAVRFRLDTTGEMYSSASNIKITPTFYFVDANGKNRRQVDLYYKEEIDDVVYPIVKVGTGVDLVNIQSGTTGNIYSRIPEEELQNTAKVLDTTYSKLKNQFSTMYSYSQIKLLKAFRTFVGTAYSSSMTGLDSYADVKTSTGQTKTSLSMYMQRWYGTYKIPTNVHAVASGYDVFGYLRKHGIDYKEDFWLTGGYIIVNFNIVTVDENGKEHLSYINADNYLKNDNCSMWVTEGAITQKTDNKGVTFNFKAGDFIVYYTDKKASDDYSGELY